MYFLLRHVSLTSPSSLLFIVAVIRNCAGFQMLIRNLKRFDRGALSCFVHSCFRTYTKLCRFQARYLVYINALMSRKFNLLRAVVNVNAMGQTYRAGDNALTSMSFYFLSQRVPLKFICLLHYPILVTIK